jgi:hypothetical protein
MTLKLIRSVAAACLAAALLPAQEKEEIIVRLSESNANASSKASGISAKNLKAIIEKLSDDELSSADREKLKSVLMKMLGDVSGKSAPKVIRFGGPVGVDVAIEAKPLNLRWQVGQGKEGTSAKVSKKAKSSDVAQTIEWLHLAEDDNKVKKAKGGDLGDGAKQLRVRFRNPDSEGAIIDYVVDTKSGDGKSERLMKAKKAYDEAKKAYVAAKKADGKVRKGKSITFQDVPKGVRHVGKEGQGGKGSFVFDTSTKSGKANKGLVVIDTWSESKTVDKGDLDTVLKLLIQGDGKDAHGVWVVGGEDSKADGAWVTETPSVAKEVLLKLLGGKDAKGKGGKGNQAVLLKVLEGARVHSNDVQVMVESADGPAIDENREEESGEGEVREVIEEMRAEMRELRQMVQEIRKSLRSNRASSNSATRVRTDRLLPPPIREKGAAQIRVRHR